MAGPRSLLPLWLMLPAILPPLPLSHPPNQTNPPYKEIANVLVCPIMPRPIIATSVLFC